MDTTTVFGATLASLLHNPGSFLVILPVSIMAFVLEKWALFPSRLISPVCLALGMVLFPALVKSSTIPPEYPYPLVVLVLNGFILGFVAWLAHAFIIARLIAFLQPVQAAAKEVAAENTAAGIVPANPAVAPNPAGPKLTVTMNPNPPTPPLGISDLKP